MNPINHVLTHNVERVYPTADALQKMLESGKKLRLYMGIDPTSPHLHIGHAMQLKKLREFQDLGHEVILLIGSFTAMIGDPTDKAATRKQLTADEVMANAQTYKDQAAKIIRFDGENAVKILFNNDWLAKLTMKEILELSSQFTVSQMLERDMFEGRFYGKVICPGCESQFTARSLKLLSPDVKYKNKYGEEAGNINHAWIVDRRLLDEVCPSCRKSLKDFISYPEESSKESVVEKWKDFLKNNVSGPAPIGLHEFMYPLMQGFDSVAMDVDIEIGGSDQTFNMLAGRTLMKAGVLGHKAKEKFVITLKLLTNDEGKKMSKSEGGMIAIDDVPEDMFGKIMSMNDDMIASYFACVLDATENDLTKIKNRLDSGENPRDIKMELAERVVGLYHGNEAGEKARTHFVQVFQEHSAPEEMDEVQVADGTALVDVLVNTKLATSKTNARQLIEQGGVKLGDRVVTDVAETIDASLLPLVLQKGKRGFVRLIR
ncbi:MAG: tyrosine--tRNA ligase [Patescibacteria group bacterium]